MGGLAVVIDRTGGGGGGCRVSDMLLFESDSLHHVIAIVLLLC